jgi:hypothetical protein
MAALLLSISVHKNLIEIFHFALKNIKSISYMSQPNSNNPNKGMSSTTLRGSWFARLD